MNKLKMFLRRWLEIDRLHERVDQHTNDLQFVMNNHVNAATVDHIVGEHLMELKEFLKPEPVKVSEPRTLRTAPKTWSAFRGKIQTFGELSPEDKK